MDTVVEDCFLPPVFIDLVDGGFSTKVGLTIVGLEGANLAMGRAGGCDGGGLSLDGGSCGGWS